MKTRKQFRFSDATLQYIEDLKRLTGLDNATAVVEMAIKKQADDLLDREAMHLEYMRRGWIK